MDEGLEDVEGRGGKGGGAVRRGRGRNEGRGRE